MTQENWKEKNAAAARHGVRYGVWRWLAPVDILTENGDELPASSLAKILSLTGFSDLKSLMSELDKSLRNQIPEALQERLRRLLYVEVNPDAVDREISLEIDEDSFEVPFPFKADGDAEAAVIIAGFEIKENNRAATLQVSARIGVTTTNMLSPRKPEDEDFCRLICEEKIDDPNPSGIKVIADWLTRNGVKSGVAKKAAEDEELRFQLRLELYDRIEELAAVSGALGLLDNDELVILQGEEEKGFSAD